MKILTTILVLMLTIATKAQGASFGLGLGGLYNGVGINVGVERAQTFFLGSVGCSGLSSGSGSDSSSDGDKHESRDFGSACGAGLAALQRGEGALSRHAVGLSLSLNDDTFLDDTSVLLGLPYVYLFSGQGFQGWGLGLTPGLRFVNDKSDGFFMLNLGYQF